MDRFTTHETSVTGLTVVKRRPIIDSRGFFVRLFCGEELLSAGWRLPIVQVNHTFTRKRGTVRGLHFQKPPYTEMKMVSCIRGAVWDVNVDLRAGSPTFLQWHAEELSESNSHALIISEGFAHGFQTLTDDCELIYFHNAAYVAENEGALNAIDPRLRIRWPQPITEQSVRDKTHPMLSEDFRGLLL